MSVLDRGKIQLCDIQGRLFELSPRYSLDSPTFMQTFMESQAAAALDDTYDRLQWAGEEYILEQLNDDVGGLKKAGVLYSREVMYWSGYVYRYWHFLTGESSREIVRIAPPSLMEASWLGFHTLDVEMAIENLKEMYHQN